MRSSDDEIAARTSIHSSVRPPSSPDPYISGSPGHFTASAIRQMAESNRHGRDRRAEAVVVIDEAQFCASWTAGSSEPGLYRAAR